MKTRTTIALAVYAAAIVALTALAAVSQPRRQLRICADPNNLPFSNDRRQGLENRLADIVAHEMNATVRYTWWPQRRGFVRHTLGAGACDVLMGVPRDYDLALTTRPYYRSGYVFVSRQGGGVRSFDDPVLRTLRIGVHVVGDDYANVPPAHALARRRLVSNVLGYSIFGDYSKPNPPARLIEAVAKGEVDLAIAWGPLAGYFASRQAVPLEIVPVAPDTDDGLPVWFDISVGVRRGDVALQQELDAILERKAAAIQKLLQSFGVPSMKRQ